MPMSSNYNSEYNNFRAITNLHNKIYNNVANVNENVNIVLRGSLVHSWGPPDFEILNEMHNYYAYIIKTHKNTEVLL